MGSGQGKQRRTRAVASRKSAGSLKAVKYDHAKWEEFVICNGLKSVRVYEYYIGRGISHHDSDAERNKVVNELFADAVEVGAIFLPSSTKVEDFQFDVKSDALGTYRVGMYRQGMIRTAFKGKRLRVL